MSLARTLDIARVAALAAWRSTQGVYRFDATLLHELLATPLDGALPTEHLQRLPEWCIYVELGLSGICGFFAHLEYDLKAQKPELMLLVDCPESLVPVAIRLDGTLNQALSSFVSHAEHAKAARGPASVGEVAHMVAPLVSVLLYLCAADAEMRPTRDPKRTHAPASVKRGKDGEAYLPPAKRPEVWETGFNLGPALRDATARTGAEGPEQGPRGHIRRAHWHSYWRGSGDERQLEIRWLPPIAVKLEIPQRATLRRVR